MTATLIRSRPLLTLTCTAVFAFGSIFAATSASAHIRDEPESLRSLLGLDVDGTVLDELQFQAPTYRIYTTKDKSLVTFRVKDDVFVYTIRTPNHLTEAKALVEAMSGKSVRAVVAVQPFRSERFARFFEVRAFRITQQKAR